MLARSTAWRQGRAEFGEGHVDQQQVAVADQQVGRLDVAVGQAGVPQLADDAQAVVDHALVDLGLAQLGGPGEELGDQQVLPLRGQLHDPVGSWGGQPGQIQLVEGVVFLWTSRRTVLNGFSSSSRPYSSSRPSLYQRSARRWLRAYSLPNRTVGGSPVTVIRRGVEPAEPASPNGSTSSTTRPS